MIIQVEGASEGDVAGARRGLAALADGWGTPVTETAPPRGAEEGSGHGVKGIDPVALASLVVSLPSAALAVADLADRIAKRKRARELIEHAELLSEKRVTAIVVTKTRTVELRSLTPDQLLDLVAAEDDD